MPERSHFRAGADLADRDPEVDDSLIAVFAQRQLVDVFDRGRAVKEYVRRDQPPLPPPQQQRGECSRSCWSTVSPVADVSRFLEQVLRWASACPEIVAVGLTGSWARGTATTRSDVDLVVIVDEVRLWLSSSDWIAFFGDHDAVHDEDWGALVSRRVHYRDGVEAEFGFTTRRWAAPPLDDGTVRVLGDGFKVLYDPTELLTDALTEAGLKVM